MALDALVIRNLTKEIADAVIGGRIDKIHQPEKDEIVLHIRTYENNYKIVISAGTAHPRLHFTSANKKNPISAPLFCMLLRKHLGSGKIVNIYQSGFERIVFFDIESYDELGELSVKHLIVEIMGRHSNIILANSDMKIIDCIKRIDFSVSSVRQVLPGLTYELPPVQGKIPLTEFSGELNASAVGDEPASRLLMNNISGISPLTAREIIYSAYKTANLKISEIKDFSALEKAIFEYSEKVKNNEFKPCMIKDNKANKILDFSSVDIHQYDGFAEVIYKDSMSEILDMFYTSRDALERMKQKSADISKLLHTLAERAYKKRLILAKTVDDAKNKEKYKINGDLIMANLYSVEKNAKSVEVSNYFEESCPTVKIELDPQLSALQNAQRYYKKYQKAKTAEVEAAIQANQNDETIEYLESTIVSLDNCKSEADINAIRAELEELGYIKKRNTSTRKSTTKPTETMPPTPLPLSPAQSGIPSGVPLTPGEIVVTPY